MYTTLATWYLEKDRDEVLRALAQLAEDVRTEPASCAAPRADIEAPRGAVEGVAWGA
jgi:hypothetical protein